LAPNRLLTKTSDEVKNQDIVGKDVENGYEQINNPPVRFSNQFHDLEFRPKWNKSYPGLDACLLEYSPVTNGGSDSEKEDNKKK
jgi:hypothetical protein